MKITAVESSTLATVGYDEGSELLELEFCSGAVYRYFVVPAAIHESLLAAESKGNYFNRAIRGRYRFVRTDAQLLAGTVVDANTSANQRGSAWPAL